MNLALNDVCLLHLDFDNVLYVLLLVQCIKMMESSFRMGFV